MCSIRSIYLLDESGTVLLSRHYSTVERRVKRKHACLKSTTAGNVETPANSGNGRFLPYERIRIPPDDIFSDIFRYDYLTHFRHGSSKDYPIISLGLRGQMTGGPSDSDPHARHCVLWPLITIHCHNAFLVAIPEVDGFLVPRLEKDRPSAAQLPCVTATLKLLEDLAPFVSRISDSSSGSISTESLATFQCQLCSIMPFGTPIETDMHTVGQVNLAGSERHRRSAFGTLSVGGRNVFSASASQYEAKYFQKRPAWKPEVRSKRGQKLRLRVVEYVSAMIYGHDQDVDAEDVCETRGVVECDSQLNDVPEVSLSLSCGGNAWLQRETHVDEMQGKNNTDESIEGIDEVPHASSTNQERKLKTRLTGGSNICYDARPPEIVLVHTCALPPTSLASPKIIFSPPLGSFELAHYSFGQSKVSARPSSSGETQEKRRPGSLHTLQTMPVRGLYQVEPVNGSLDRHDKAFVHSTHAPGIVNGQAPIGNFEDATVLKVRIHLRWGIPIKLLAAKGKTTVKEFSVSLPFSGYGKIMSHKLDASTGTFHIIHKSGTSSLNGSRTYSCVVWHPGSKFKEEGADAILSGIITISKLPPLPPTPPAPLCAAPALTSGLCTGNRSTVPLSNQAEALEAQQREKDSWFSEGPTTESNVGKSNDIEGGNLCNTHDLRSDPVLQRKEPEEAWVSWAEFAADDLDMSEVYGGASKNISAVEKRTKKGAKDTVIDPMCVGQNCYAAVSFRIDGFTISGMHVDQSAIAIQPSTSATVSTGLELCSDTYLIWNKYGNARCAIQPERASAQNVYSEHWR